MNINMNGAVTTTGELNKMCHSAEKKKKKKEVGEMQDHAPLILVQPLSYTSKGNSLLCTFMYPVVYPHPEF